MKLKRLGLVLVSILALSAVVVSSAYAETTEEEVVVGGVPTKVKTTRNRWRFSSGSEFAKAESVLCSKASEKLTLEGTVLGAATKLTATGVECKEASLENVTNGERMAVGKGKLVFTGVTVDEPAGCGVSSTIETAPLHIRVWHHIVNQTTTLKGWIRFTPVEEGGNFASIKITGCAIAGTYPVKGATYGTPPNDTCVYAKNQKLKFNEETNSFGSLKFGGNPASITGEANNELSSGAEFSACEE